MPDDRTTDFDPREILIAHVSDPHFGSPAAEDVWELVRLKLDAIKPDLLLVTGDLVHTPNPDL